MTRSLTLALALCTLSAAAFAAPPGPGRPQGGPSRTASNGPQDEGPQQGQTLELQGTVKSFNLSPRGEPESLMLMGKDKLVQVNFPPPFAEALSKAAPVGSTVSLSVAPDAPPRQGPGGPNGGGQGGAAGMSGQGRGGPRTAAQGRGQGGNGRPGGPPPGQGMRGAGQAMEGGGGQGGPNAQQPPAHPVFRLVSMKDASGHDLTPPRPEIAHVEGTISALNYDRRAVLNGAQLSTGDLLHLGPREAQQATLNVGEKVSADGPADKLPNGHLSVHVQQLNGQDLRPQGPGNDGPPPPPPGNDDGQMPPPPPPPQQ